MLVFRGGGYKNNARNNISYASCQQEEGMAFVLLLSRIRREKNKSSTVDQKPTRLLHPMVVDTDSQKTFDTFFGPPKKTTRTNRFVFVLSNFLLVDAHRLHIVVAQIMEMFATLIPLI